mmetsp:Transcript_35728/g.54679  ORF Transcript_35728/g.54679 Transcript_35728/m.54679 type:complete len:117 (-) Transcript_35728:74-424(-)|eukprot:CAMPEP_0170511580 /NCGR_PEP_ID=MMETSP0208-20121228/66384_1 /TAXON_ID=197538 /ORGANISM="Strombidium inclinatum, Strain S3" /LENGTH=116 /DNA_ID=CAMNT_0010795137 /DNA_START=707 /DNA_END=1057 /DNA_ORIENTATION=+
MNFIESVCSLVIKKVIMEGEPDRVGLLREFLKTNKTFKNFDLFRKKKAKVAWAEVQEEMKVHALFKDSQPTCFILELHIMEVEARGSLLLDQVEADLKKVYAFEVIANANKFIGKF